MVEMPLTRILAVCAQEGREELHLNPFGRTCWCYHHAVIATTDMRRPVNMEPHLSCPCMIRVAGVRVISMKINGHVDLQQGASFLSQLLAAHCNGSSHCATVDILWYLSLRHELLKSLSDLLPDAKLRLFIKCRLSM